MLAKLVQFLRLLDPELLGGLGLVGLLQLQPLDGLDLFGLLPPLPLQRLELLHLLNLQPLDRLDLLDLEQGLWCFGCFRRLLGNIVLAFANHTFL